MLHPLTLNPHINTFNGLKAALCPKLLPVSSVPRKPVDSRRAPDFPPALETTCFPCAGGRRGIHVHVAQSLDLESDSRSFKPALLLLAHDLGLVLRCPGPVR